MADLSATYQQSKAELKATETRLKDVNRQLRLLGQYFKTKAVYREYLKGGKRKDFAAAHRSELELTMNELLAGIEHRISSARKSKKMTQEVLAEFADVSYQTISSVELGKKALRPENIIKISQAL